MSYPEDILGHIEDARTAFGQAKTIEQAEAAWTHFYRIKSYVEMSWANDKAIMNALDNLERGLSTFTLQVRQGMPSPYSGWGVAMTTLQSLVSPRYGADGYPKR